MTHLLDSSMIFIHPPLACLGYLMVFLCLVLIFEDRRHPRFHQWIRKCLNIAWFFTLLGLASGMLWAQLAWGSYWSWDPKETLTLVLFLCVGCSAMTYEKKKKISTVLLLLAVVFMILNIGVTIGDFGLHSYG